MENRVFNGARLRTARNFNGWSLEQVGEAVGATKQYIQQLEKNAEKQPAQELLEALAKLLGVKPSYFYSADKNAICDDQCHFRKLQATTISLKNQALAHGTFFDELTECLDDILHLPDVNFPSIAPKDMAHIEEIAEQCRVKWKLGLTAPIKNMVRVVENAGALVTYFAEVSEKIDAFSFQRKRPFIIRNSLKQSVCRMRFDIAHECGHIVMHGGVDTGDKKTEDEANKFASAFLLPRAAFLKEFPKGSRFDWPALCQMKIRWRVSLSAIIRRAYDLGIIDAIQYRIGNVHIRKTSQNRQEVYDDNFDLIPAESPELLPSAFAMLEKQAPELILEIMDRMGVEKELLEKIIGTKINLNKSLLMDSEDKKVIRLSEFRKNLRR